MSLNRAARLERLEQLLARGRLVTATEASQTLGVSARSLHRDVAELRARGVPVSAAPGRGGGLRLDPRHAATAIRFAEDEVVALWLAAELTRLSATLPWGRAASSGLERAFAALPLGRRRQLRALLARVVVAEAASPAIRAGAGPPPAELLSHFEQAFTAHHALRFTYTDRTGVETRRLVEPHGLMVQVPVWYVLGWDVEKAAARMFRMDRIRSPRPAPEARFTPRLEVIAALRDG